MSVLIFKNFSEEPFEGRWDGVVQVVNPGQEVYLEDWKARHFAKHLIDRELNKKNILTGDKIARAELETLCLPQVKEEVTVAEILDKNEKAKTSKTPKAPKTPKTVEKGETGEKGEEEGEFEDLDKLEEGEGDEEGEEDEGEDEGEEETPKSKTKSAKTK